MANKLMYIPNDDTQNYPFCSLQLVVEAFKSKIHKSPKVVKPTDKKKLL